MTNKIEEEELLLQGTYLTLVQMKRKMNKKQASLFAIFRLNEEIYNMEINKEYSLNSQLFLRKAYH